MAATAAVGSLGRPAVGEEMLATAAKLGSLGRPAVGEGMVWHGQ